MRVRECDAFARFAELIFDKFARFDCGDPKVFAMIKRGLKEYMPSNDPTVADFAHELRAMSKSMGATQAMMIGWLCNALGKEEDKPLWEFSFDSYLPSLQKLYRHIAIATRDTVQKGVRERVKEALGQGHNEIFVLLDFDQAGTGVVLDQDVSWQCCLGTAGGTRYQELYDQLKQAGRAFDEELSVHGFCLSDQYEQKNCVVRAYNTVNSACYNYQAAYEKLGAFISEHAGESVLLKKESGADHTLMDKELIQDNSALVAWYWANLFSDYPSCTVWPTEKIVGDMVNPANPAIDCRPLRASTKSKRDILGDDESAQQLRVGYEISSSNGCSAVPSELTTVCCSRSISPVYVPQDDDFLVTPPISPSKLGGPTPFSSPEGDGRQDVPKA